MRPPFSKLFSIFPAALPLLLTPPSANQRNAR
jgi:hypothetical protein